MPSWFSKVFKNKPKESPEAVREEIERKNPPLFDDGEDPYGDDDDEAPPVRAQARAVIELEVIEDDLEEAFQAAGPSDDIRIKAAVAPDMMSCRFMVDRPVFEGYSLYAHSPETAEEASPLAAEIFKIEGVSQVEIYHMNVTVTRAGRMGADWKAMATAIGRIIREHLQSGKPVVTESFLDNLPPEAEIAERLQKVIELDINPGIAAHSGEIALNRVEGNTVFIRMMGGCQGCAASDITLKIGIHQGFRDAVPQVGAILDETDHSAGTNPFYKTLPAGMSADA